MNDHSLFVYLFVIDRTQRELGDALKLIDQLPEVENWQIILPDAAALVSRLTTQQLNQKLRAIFPNQKYIVTLLERGKKAGWLAKTSWNFMNEPTSVFEE
jgi:hypothetical protein